MSFKYLIVSLFLMTSWSHSFGGLRFSTKIEPFSPLYCARLGIRVMDKFDPMRMVSNYQFIQKRYKNELIKAKSLDQRMSIENKISLLDVAFHAIQKEGSFLASIALDSIREKKKLSNIGIPNHPQKDAFSSYRDHLYSGESENFFSFNEQERVQALLHFGIKVGGESMLEAIPFLLSKVNANQSEELLKIFWSIEDANQALGEGNSFERALSRVKRALDQHVFTSKVMLLTHEEVFQVLSNAQKLVFLLGKMNAKNDQLILILGDFAYWYQSRLLQFFGIPLQKRQALYLEWSLAKNKEWIFPKPKLLNRLFMDCNSTLKGFVQVLVN